MEITLKLKLPKTQYATDNREGFWHEYCRRADLPYSDEGFERKGPDERYSPQRLEALIKSRFMPRLNDALSYRFGRRGDGPGRVVVVGETEPPFANVVITLERMEYNSLELILKVLGLDNGALVPLLGAALEVYAIEAFNNSMPGDNVDFDVSTHFDSAILANNSGQGQPKRPPINIGNAGLNKMWGILNGSLILPVLLALGVLLQGLMSLNEQRNEITKERELLAQERIAMMKLATSNAASDETKPTDAKAD